MEIGLILESILLCFLWFNISDWLLIKSLFSGIPKPKATDQPSLIAIVVKLVRRMIQQFNNDDIKWVWTNKGGKTGVLNVECRSINVASTVKSTFAGLVKSERPPSYLKNVSDYFSF